MDQEKLDVEHAEWHKLLEKARNSDISNGTSEVTYNIEVAEVLGVGNWHSKPPEVAVVRDVQGNIWQIPETDANRDGKAGLVSRHNVKPGMRILLLVKREVRLFFVTEAYPLNTNAK